MQLSLEQMEAIAEQEEIAEVIRQEEELEARKLFVPWLPVDGGETNAREE